MWMKVSVQAAPRQTEIAYLIRSEDQYNRFSIKQPKRAFFLQYIYD